ncbi:MAG TPA: hypothetical protein VIA98_04190 [Allosphingosinicella sp.]|jgi:hypothetical protein
MAAQARIGSAKAMASPWRRRRMCVLVSDTPAPAALREVSARGAFLETNARPPLGASVELRHPEAGSIRGTVHALAHDGVKLGFACSETSVAFAVAAIAADMSRAG